MSGAQVIISGFGGQGVILAGQILGRAVSVHEGRNAVMAQSYGPESRGGACKTEVILSDGAIEYPRVVEPDVVVVLSQPAYDENGKHRPDGCLLIAEEDLVTLDPEAELGKRAMMVPATRLAEQLGKKIVLNIVTLGFLCGASDIVSAEALKEAIAASVPKGTEALNLKAFDAGFSHAAKVGAAESRHA